MLVLSEAIGIFTKIKTHSAVRLEFYYEARRLGAVGSALGLDQNELAAPEGELLASGSSSHMWLNKNWKPVRIHTAAPEIYQLIQDKSVDQTI